MSIFRKKAIYFLKETAPWPFLKQPLFKSTHIMHLNNISLIKYEDFAKFQVGFQTQYQNLKFLTGF